MKKALIKITALARYAELKRRVRDVLLSGQRAIEALKVRSYWETGYYINQHVRLRGGRAEYGRQIMVKLSEDLEIDDSILRRCAEFAEKFPHLARLVPGARGAGDEIRATWHELMLSPRQTKGKDFRNGLTWSHFRTLLPVENERTRWRLATKAARENWTVPRLEAEVKKIRRGKTSRHLPSLKQRSSLLVPKWGRLHTYQLLNSKTSGWPEEELWLDHGFRNYSRLSEAQSRRIKEGQIVPTVHVIANPAGVKQSQDSKIASGASHPRNDHASQRLQIVRVRGGAIKVFEGGTKKDLYTYRAYVSRVIDGDTFWAVLDLDLDFRTRQKIRLRGVDTPELGTREGKEALEFVKKILLPAPFLILYSSRSEKFDRYLGDVFVPTHGGARDLVPNTAPPPTESKIEIVDGVACWFLNNLLLERGLAVRAEE